MCPPCGHLCPLYLSVCPLSPPDQPFRPDPRSLFETSQSLFWASFGLVELDAFELVGLGSFTRFWAMLMFGSYSVINVIVLLNLLIAMMSNSYNMIHVSFPLAWDTAGRGAIYTPVVEPRSLPSVLRPGHRVLFLSLCVAKTNLFPSLLASSRPHSHSSGPHSGWLSWTPSS